MTFFSTLIAIEPKKWKSSGELPDSPEFRFKLEIAGLPRYSRYLIEAHYPNLNLSQAIGTYNLETPKLIKFSREFPGSCKIRAFPAISTFPTILKLTSL